MDERVVDTGMATQVPLQDGGTHVSSGQTLAAYSSHWAMLGLTLSQREMPHPRLHSFSEQPAASNWLMYGHQSLAPFPNSELL